MRTDRNEEQAHEDVAKRPDFILDVVLELGLGEHDAGEKSAHRERQPHLPGKPGGEQGDHQDEQGEQFIRVRCRDDAHSRAHEVLAGIVDHGEGDCAFRQRQADRYDQRFITLCGKNRYQYQEWHHGEVLEQQYAERNVAVRQVQLVVIGQQLGDDGGRGHGERAADRERDLPGQADDPDTDDHGRQRRDDYLGHTDTQDDVAHG